MSVGGYWIDEPFGDGYWVCPACLIGWVLRGDEQPDEFADRHQDTCEGDLDDNDDGGY